MDKALIEHPDGVGEFKFQDKKCLDRIRLFIKVEKDKISKVDSSAEGCKKTEEAAEFLVKNLKNKPLKDLKLDFSKLKDKHTIELAEKTLERTLKNYEQFKNDPLDEVVDIIRSYEEGYPERDPRYDFEY